MLKLINDLADKVLAIEPIGKLTAEDNLTALVPELDDKLRQINKHHRNNVKRLAVVSRDHVVAVLPLLAKRFLVEESRHFPIAKKIDVLIWVSQAPAFRVSQ
jgi:hypothetical protein